MIAKLIKIGNSSGFIIPKMLLIEAGIDDNAEMSLSDKGIIIAPFKKKLRDVWAEQLAQLSPEAFELGEEDKEWLDFSDQEIDKDWN